MKLARVIQAEEATLPPAARGKFRQHSRKMAPHALYPAGAVQFWEEANDHALSLPSAAPERNINGSSL